MSSKEGSILIFAAAPIDPNELIDTTGIGWEEGILAAVVVVVAIVLAAFARRIVRTAAPRWLRVKPDLAVFLGRLAGWFIILLGVVSALMILGFQLGPMVLIIAVVGVILFLSARTLFENLGAGIVIQTENPFRIGDLVEVGERTGTVVDITSRATVIDTYDGRRIRIPNSAVLDNPIVNYAERGKLRTEITVGVEYGTDLDRAQEVILDAVREIEGVLAEPAPEAPVVGFGESAINLSVRYWHEPTKTRMYELIDKVARAIDRRYRAEGMVIAFPQIVVWKGDREG